MTTIAWRYRLLAIVAGNIGAFGWFLAVRPVWPLMLDLEGGSGTLLLFLLASAVPALWVMAALTRRPLPSYLVSALWGLGVGVFTYFVIVALFCLIFQMPLFAAIALLPTIGLGVAAPAGIIAGVAARAVLGHFDRTTVHAGG